LASKSPAIEKVTRLLDEVRRYIVGYEDLLKLMAVALISEGHILIEGPPGTGKTTLARTFAMLIGGTFRRIQVTPDLLPSDILGTYYYDFSNGRWLFREGPVFANVVLVDELNRAPPRTQAALLEAMQERQVSIEGRVHELPKPFLVLATQMPTGAEGTYPLTPVLIDRFAYSYSCGYLSPEHEMEIVKRVDMIELERPRPVMELSDVIELQKTVRTVYVSQRVLKYIVDLVNFVRSQPEVSTGPSPRASIWLMKGARALALLEGLDYVVPDHVKRLAPYVLSHRIWLKPEARLAGEDPRTIVRRALESVEVPKT